MSRPYAGRPGAGPGVPSKSILGVLQATPLDDTKPVLPAGKQAQLEQEETLKLTH